MALTVDLLLLILALVCFLAAAFNVQSRIGLVPLGLFFWCLTQVV